MEQITNIPKNFSKFFWNQNFNFNKNETKLLKNKNWKKKWIRYIKNLFLNVFEKKLKKRQIL